jgi:hypothetical protein
LTFCETSNQKVNKVDVLRNVKSKGQQSWRFAKRQIKRSTKLTFCETSNQKKDFINDSAYRYNHHHQQHQHQHQQGPPSKSPSIIMATTLPPAADAAAAAAESKTRVVMRQKKRNTHKSWLPVVFSSSFIPTKQDEYNSPESPSITSSSIQLLAIWSRTIACDCTYPARWIICTRIAADFSLIKSHSFFLLQHVAIFHSKKKFRLDGTYLPEKTTPLVLLLVLDVAQC